VNFRFEVGDIVVLVGGGQRMVLVHEFVRGLFHAKLPDGRILRVRSSQLLRVQRPSDDVKRTETDRRKAERAVELSVRRSRVERNKQEFGYLAQFRIPLTADGLPDKRYKPKYTAANSPKGIRRKPRGGLL